MIPGPGAVGNAHLDGQAVGKGFPGSSAHRRRPALERQSRSVEPVTERHRGPRLVAAAWGQVVGLGQGGLNRSDGWRLRRRCRYL